MGSNPGTHDVRALAGIDPAVAAYHERSKHGPHGFAPGPGYLDWATQPDPFRRYAGAPVVKLPLPAEGRALPYADLYVEGRVPSAPLTLETLSLFFRYALSLTAWKEIPGSRWALRANPSSGNLHPTEGYAVLPSIEGIHGRPAVWHYAPKEHALERRAELTEEAWKGLMEALPPGSFLVGLASIHWREAWKYGERAFRYCHHDVGHALGSMRLAAAANGWGLTMLDGCGDEDVEGLLGVGRLAAGPAEREEPDLLAVVSPGGARPSASAVSAPVGLAWTGTPNVLSDHHEHEWPAIETVAKATRKPSTASAPRDVLDGLPEQAGAAPAPPRLTAERAILGRRSAVAMDGTTAIASEDFFAMMARLVPSRGNGAVPFDAIPWRPRIHLAMFVHRVRGLAPGLYALVRDASRLDALRSETHPGFAWKAVTGELPLYFLAEGDSRDVAAHVSCTQEIAGDGVFSLGMLADFGATLREHGAWAYRRLFWEAGLVGQVLYLEAEEAGIRGTGIG
ncbi:MAG: nitroreductase family protein [Planctomycetota bacterium]